MAATARRLRRLPLNGERIALCVVAHILKCDALEAIQTIHVRGVCLDASRSPSRVFDPGQAGVTSQVPRDLENCPQAYPQTFDRRADRSRIDIAR